MSESMRAALAAMGPRMSGGFFWSAERTVTMIWTSWRNPLGKRGLMGRSVMRAERMAFSPGRPLPAHEASRDLPHGVVPFLKLHREGRKSASTGVSEAWAVARTTVSA